VSGRGRARRPRAEPPEQHGDRGGLAALRAFLLRDGACSVSRVKGLKISAPGAPGALMTRATYWDYIRVEELLSLQGGLDDDEAGVSNDELVFVVVHQIYELWFKIVLRELTSARDLFRLDPVPDQRLASAVRALRRVVTVVRHAVAHFEVVETMTTHDFLAFR